MEKLSANLFKVGFSLNSLFITHTHDYVGSLIYERWT
jgi:hypothetical protein